VNAVVVLDVRTTFEFTMLVVVVTVGICVGRRTNCSLFFLFLPLFGGTFDDRWYGIRGRRPTLEKRPIPLGINDTPLNNVQAMVSDDG
jgi:hypothetical protein